ncbi:hypothetical protein [Methylobacterium nodulans]|uniref:Uncharacterized protein n=1 Tax=Methylobacterium nodulans (strain LMG 21967 / CNCM I-2342 / ORS 2060) TaxID=460265 RepID=B8IHC2_METNO|nr:hypothetical protein [Methylobacterium nodulans]ACL59814.1 hypothetical protein Mnod_4957 [Methylobacterium nodulans ORS 2060]
MQGLARGIVVLGVMLAGVQAAHAQPIKSPQDQACRDEARARVFSTPDPQGVGPYVIGRQIYMACMQRASHRASVPHRRAAKRVKRAKRAKHR